MKGRDTEGLKCRRGAKNAQKWLDMLLYDSRYCVVSGGCGTFNIGMDIKKEGIFASGPVLSL